MLQHDFEHMVKQACQTGSLPLALAYLKQVEEEEIASAAESLSGQFMIADIEGEQRIYHVTVQESESGESEELAEYIMNEGDDVIRFVAWFFDTLFSIKQKETYQAAGKTYTQPKRK
ncbi:hypothetical protein [Vibrio mangrovi]|uniref:Uncharacterized protein n=1 Tax=Vibrio mangrovi TaxID=474394 RepID=A0A1Y6IW17_9VIBR|nr:hypothetical protein [Vibrio mangrovi]MDW6005048.1 hypothetical protein [Vibrio mangrovi]SMS01816.1 hypothetical protein VIM7927_03124 [Vibrio mangrovi]